MRFTVVVPKKVQKEIDKIDSRYRSRLLTALILLAANPYIGKKLEGKHECEWSYRAWPYRILYEIRKKELVVLVIHIGHRQGVYKKY